MAAGRAHRRGHRPWRAARARGDPGVQRDQRLAQPGPRPDQVLPGVVVGDVRYGARIAADRAHVVPPAQPVRGGEGLRAFPDPELPGVLRDVRGVRDLVQSRVAAPRRRVRQPEGVARRGQDQARLRAPAPAGQPAGPAGLGVRRRLRARHAPDAGPGRARRLRGRHGRHARGRGAGGAGLRGGRPGLAGPRGVRRRVHPASRGGPPVREPVQGAGRARHSAPTPGSRLRRRSRRPGCRSRRSARSRSPPWPAGARLRAGMAGR